MNGRFIAVVGAFVLLCGAPRAQLGPTTSGTLRVFVQDMDRNPIAYATVEVMDYGGFSVPGLGSKATDGNGQVEFSIINGDHRIRVVASGYVTYEGSFETMPADTLHVEYIRLRPKPGTAVAGGPGAPVPAVRLKIPPQARREFEIAAKALERNDYKQATEHFRAATQQYPDYDLAYNGLGIALLGQKDLAGAKQAFEHAVKITPEFAAAERGLARIHIAEAHWKEAETALKSTLVQEPSNGWALMNVAYAELQMGQFADAVANAQKVHAAPHAGLENAHYIAGVALEQLGKPNEARAEYGLYLKEAPSGPNAAHAQAAVARLKSPKE